MNAHFIIANGKLTLVSDGGSRAPLGIRHVRQRLSEMPAGAARDAYQAGADLWDRQ